MVRLCRDSFELNVFDCLTEVGDDRTWNDSKFTIGLYLYCTNPAQDPLFDLGSVTVVHVGYVTGFPVDVEREVNLYLPADVEMEVELYSSYQSRCSYQVVEN